MEWDDLPDNGIEDMITLRNLSEQSLLMNLKKRYQKNLIYTYTGSILVSVNPFKQLPIYTQSIVNQYLGQRMGVLPPHVFATADSSYYHMQEDRKNQSVIISGESGAGKTEATKLILQYLAAMTSEHSEVEQQILETSPILESFGNARTVRNNNSSRFGKFMQISFSSTGNITGAKIIQYLLEKSRIVYQAKDERNYHIFYQLVQGADNEEKKTYLIQEPSSYHYLNQSGIIVIPGGKIDDGEDFFRTKNALSFLKLDETKQKQIFKILGAVLQLGNVTFNPGPHDSSEYKNPEVISNVAKLLEVDENKLKESLVKRTMVVTNQTLILTLKPEQAEESRDALSKTLYSRLFQWLVEMINLVICKAETSNSAFIGILDIFGFENFKVNSFEQLCINYANEKLQQHFNHHIFKLEQEEYDKEKINWSKITFKDNQETIDLIEQLKPKPGIIALLDEQCRFPKASDKTFLDQVLSNYEGKHGNFDKNKRVQNQFIIKHYAGDVSYTITGFLDKNRDTLFVDLLNTMITSQSSLIKALFKDVQSDTDAQSGGAKKQVRSVAGFFRSQLTDLTGILSSTYAHYVRCIKPNMAQAADNYDEDMVLAQLRYAGMMETIKIRRNGYPIRYPHDEFWKRYRMLAPEAALSGTNYRKACDDMLPRVKTDDPDDWQNGLTKVFLRERMYAFLEDKRSYLLSFSAIKCQAFWRMAMVRGYFLDKKDACKIFQKEMRGYLARNHWTKLRNGSILLQSITRMLKIRAQYKSNLFKKREEERKKKEEAERKRKEEEARIRKMAEEFKKTHASDPRSVDEIMKDLLTKSEEERAEEEARRKKVAEMKLLEEEEKEREKREKEEAAKAEKVEPKPQVVEAPKKGVNIRIDDIKPDKKKGSSILKKQQQQMKAPTKEPPKYAKRLPKKPRNEILDQPDLAVEDSPFEKFPGLKKAEKKKKKSMGKLFAKKKKEEFCFSPDPLEGPLLSLSPENQKYAIEISSSILSYQNRKSSNLESSDITTVQNIIKHGMQHEELRDEIYAQLVKQSNVLDRKKVKDADAVTKCAWELLAVSVVSFPPSPELLPFLVNFFQVSKTNLFAKFCLKRLKRGFYAGGKFKHVYKRLPPSVKEIHSVIQQSSLVVKVNPYLLGEERIIQVEVDNGTTAVEALNIACAHPDLAVWDYSELSLYEDSGGLTQHPLLEDDLIVDSIARLEKKSKTADLVLTMKRRLFLPPYYSVPIQEDKTVNSITAKQLLNALSEGYLPIPDPENALVMAALKLKIIDSQKIDFKELLPAQMLKTKTLNDEENWKKTIKSKLSSFQNLRPNNVHKQIIQTAKESPLYGFTVFKTEHNNPKFKFSSPFEIAVGRAGVQFIRENDKSLICSFSYAEFSIKECRDEIFAANIMIEGQELLVEKFKSIYAVDLCNLVTDYTIRRLRECEYAIAVADYTPDDPTFMHFNKDDIIFILDKDDDKGWYSGQCGTRSGPFPKDLVSVKSDIPHDAGTRFDRGRVSLKNRLDTLGLEGVESQPEAATSYKQKLQVKRNTIIKSNRVGGMAGAAGGGGGRFGRKSLWRGTMITPIPEKLLQDEESFIEFADKYFRHRPFEKEDEPEQYEKEEKEKKEKKEKKPRKGDDFSSAKRTIYSKSAIKDSLLNIKDPKVNKESVRMFQDVMKYMGDYPTTSPSTEVGQRIVQKALEYGEELQDELYCQLMKQTTENNNQESKFHGWELFLLAVSVFLPSEKLTPYVMAHLFLGSKESNATIALFANECIQRLERTQLKGPRALAPSLKEVEIITMGAGEFQVEIFLSHSEKVSIDIDSASTVKDVIDRVMRVSNLDANPDSWTLFEEVRSLKDGNKSDVGISGSIKIGDILARWEKLGSSFLSRLVFKRWVYHEDENIDFENPFLLPYLAYQAQLQVSSGLHPVTNDEEAYELASYYLEIEIGKYTDNNWKSKIIRPWHKERDNKEAVLTSSLVKDKDAVVNLPNDIFMLTSIVDVILPPHLKTNEKKVSDALKAIEKKWLEHSELNLKKAQASTLHLAMLRKWKFFGSAQFSVSYKLDKNTTIVGSLFITGKGLFIFDGNSPIVDGKAPVKSWDYLGISSYSATSSSFTIITGNLNSPVREVFNTKFAQSIQTIFSKYASKAKTAGKPSLSKTKTVARFRKN